MLKIRFKGCEYLFTGDSLDEDGALTTEERYAAGEESYAHCFSHGAVMRYGKQIEYLEDVEVVGPVEVPTPDEAACSRLISRRIIQVM